MSYVLKALRRADAERERGSVPDLRAQPDVGLAAPDSVEAEPRHAPWLLAAAAVTLIGGIVWWFWPAPPPASAAATAAAAAAPSAPAPAPVATSAQPPLLIRIEAPAVSVAPPRPAAAAPKPAAAPEVIKLRDLPEALRRQIPPLTFGGAMDSPVAASRMLIVNGQVMREGDALAPGLRLQRITLRAAILDLNGQPVEVDY